MRRSRAVRRPDQTAMVGVNFNCCNRLQTLKTTQKQSAKLFKRWHSTCLFLVGIVFLAQEGEEGTGVSWGKRLLAGTALFVLAGSLINGQQMSVEEGKRKAKTKVNPNYPELARRMNIGGKVKIEVVIAPDGRVKTARALGGHPVLVQPCLDAVKDWKFEAAPEETTQVLEFNFKEQ